MDTRLPAVRALFPVCFLLALTACDALGPSSYVGRWTGTSSTFGTVTVTLELVSADSVSGSIATAVYSGAIYDGSLFQDSLNFVSANPGEKSFTGMHGVASRVSTGLLLHLRDVYDVSLGPPVYLSRH